MGPRHTPTEGTRLHLRPGRATGPRLPVGYHREILAPGMPPRRIADSGTELALKPGCGRNAGHRVGLPSLSIEPVSRESQRRHKPAIQKSRLARRAWMAAAFRSARKTIRTSLHRLGNAPAQSTMLSLPSPKEGSFEPPFPDTPCGTWERWHHLLYRPNQRMPSLSSPSRAPIVCLIPRRTRGRRHSGCSSNVREKFPSSAIIYRTTPQPNRQMLSLPSSFDLSHTLSDT